MTDAASDIDDSASVQTLPRLEGVPPGGAHPIARPPSLPYPAVWVFLGCLLLALFCNAGAFRGKDFIGDETSLVRDNDLLNRLPGLQTIWFGGASPSTYPLTQYAPLAQTMLFVEHAIWGDAVWPYRLVSVVLHALGGLMVWRLLRELAFPGALAVALIFIAHPMAVDNVAWFAERRIPLAAVLSLCGAFVLLRAGGILRSAEGKVKLLPDDPIRLYAIGALLVVLALFSSPAIAATVPLVILMIVWWRYEKAETALAATCVALLLAGVGMLALSSTIEKNRAGVLSPAAWNRAPTDAGELAVRAQTAGRAVVFYATMLVAPHPVAIDYPRWQTPRDVEQFRTFAQGDALNDSRVVEVGQNVLLAYAYPAVTVAVLAASWLLRHRFGRGQFLCVAGFILLLAPSLGFIDLGWMRYSFVSDRAVYLACVPFFAGLVWVGGVLLAKANDRTVTVASAGVVIAFFAILSAVIIAPRFKDATHFWKENASAVHSRRSWWPRYEVALSLLHYDPDDQKATELAVQAIEEVRRYKPDEPAAIVLAGLYRQRAGDELGGLHAFETSIQNFPAYGPAYFEAADTYRALADKQPTNPRPRLLAFQLFSEAAAADPLDARARVSLGRASWEIAKRLDPNDPNVDKYFEQAGIAFDEAIALRPYDVDLLVTISETLVEMGKLKAASVLLEQARSIAPTRGDIYEATADASMARKDYNGADVSLRLAAELEPEAIMPKLKLGNLRMLQERWREARELFETVLKLDPNNAEAKRRLAEVETSATTRPELPTTRLTIPSTQP